MLALVADQEYRALKERIGRQFAAIPVGQNIRLAKRTSNLFRARSAAAVPGLDVRDFSGVLCINEEAGTADVLGMTTYEQLVAATIPLGFMPLCIPQLRTITLGGAVTGMGIEAASFRNGAPHESVLEMDILTGTGQILTVTGNADDPHRDLFYGFPNSYGSLGYALRIKIELEPIKPFVHLRHLRFDDSEALAAAIDTITKAGELDGNPVDFIDGTVFSPNEHYLTLGEMVNALPAGAFTSDYTSQEIYYQSIPQKNEDYLTILDYLWRWDTDWFWCSRAFGAQVPAIRKLWPKSKLRSDVYWKLIALDQKYDIAARVNSFRGKPQRESVVQDIEVPISHLPAFLEFFHNRVGISPIWICPMKQRDAKVRWPLYEFDPDTMYVNVGFWSSVAISEGLTPADGVINRMIEDEVTRLGGRKSLYSTTFYDKKTFWSIYGGSTYFALKDRYDPQGRLLGLYEKVVEQR